MVSTIAPHRRARTVHLSTTHHADDARIMEKEAATLRDAGWDVSVVLPDDRFPPQQPVTHRGLRVIPVPRPSGRWGRLWPTLPQVARAAWAESGDVYHLHDPELLPVGLLFRALGKRVVYDAHEDLPKDLMTREWLPQSLRRPVSWMADMLERAAARACSGVVAATPMIAPRFPPGRTKVVQNFAVAGKRPEITLETYTARTGIALAGSITEDRCIEEVVEAMAHLHDPTAKLLLAGKIGSSELTQRLKAMPGWARVDHRGLLDRQGVEQLLSESRVGIALYRPTQNYIECRPVKLFEYLAAGIPVVTADFPWQREVVAGNDCGICVPPTDASAIAEAVDWLLAHPEEALTMGRRGRELVERQMNWATEARSLLALYDGLRPVTAAGAPHALPGSGPL